MSLSGEAGPIATTRPDPKRSTPRRSGSSAGTGKSFRKERKPPVSGTRLEGGVCKCCKKKNDKGERRISKASYLMLFECWVVLDLAKNLVGLTKFQAILTSCLLDISEDDDGSDRQVGTFSQRSRRASATKRRQLRGKMGGKVKLKWIQWYSSVSFKFSLKVGKRSTLGFLPFFVKVFCFIFKQESFIIILIFMGCMHVCVRFFVCIIWRIYVFLLIFFSVQLIS